jgi:Flp pilus assembly protein TadB
LGEGPYGCHTVVFKVVALEIILLLAAGLLALLAAGPAWRVARRLRRRRRRALYADYFPDDYPRPPRRQRPP